ncbi:hypothetical protein DXB73_03130 [Clostridium sp. OM05-6BH]|nr:MAG: hypothetical protein BHW05_02395 [Clostridium sp. 42_12]RHQ13836.1 hypothetical protein DW981_04475 [Clostridium sp. AM49-4BH]RHV16703.1 hypothetical protein DXB78_02685 [Clostridium sp. OM05-9BH]RHV20736.1 hypothetical protein DXB73_03130 [Clostridium sp. OM05-6BH]
MLASGVLGVGIRVVFCKAVCPDKISAPLISTGSKFGAVIWIEYVEYGRSVPGIMLYSNGGAGRVIRSLLPALFVSVSSIISFASLILRICILAPAIGLEVRRDVIFA